MCRRRRNSGLVPRISMTRDAYPGIIRQDSLKSLTHFRGSIRNNHLPCMQRVADADSATVMERHPRRTARDIQQGIENCPIRNCIASIAHPFGFPEWRRNAASVEMIASDHYRSGQLSRCYEIIQRNAKTSAFSLT